MTIKLQLYDYTCYGCTTIELWLYNYRGYSRTTTDFPQRHHLVKKSQTSDYQQVSILLHIYKNPEASENMRISGKLM